MPFFWQQVAVQALSRRDGSIYVRCQNYSVVGVFVHELVLAALVWTNWGYNIVPYVTFENSMCCTYIQLAVVLKADAEAEI